jgi:predicted metalloendopeptidase
LFELAGRPDPVGEARLVFDLETELARVQWTRVQNRDREATYNKRSVSDLGSAFPRLDLPAFLRHAELDVDSVIIRQPSYFRSLDSLLEAQPMEAWRAYLRGRLLHDAAPSLTSEFNDALFEYSGRTLAGLQTIPPRWRRSVDAVNATVGEAVGRIYVTRHYRQEARSRMAEMIANLRAAFRESIQDLDWMSDATEAEALEKLSMFVAKIGHPDRWRDYSSIDARGDDLIGNARQAAAYRFNYSAAKLGRPVDRLEWGMTPQTVNAYYSSTMNEIVFPAAILQPPFFDVTADDAVNYGAIGAIIGHEFSHGFDDQGRKSDGHGNLRDWWTEEDAAEYVRRADVIVAQYDAYSPIEGANVNGRLTLGENIADLAGLTLAYRAYRRSLNGEEAPIIDGLTGDQRFFYGWAQAWRSKARDEALHQQLMTDPHSPGEYRTNGIVQHLDAFHEAFGTQPGDGLWRAPADRIRIW